ncbi:hypothetical protein BD560DRAFT_393122 [Blakeslea trispora]|nr:hypothetical protein BD560DRAFT_393122 [Blakeslea trispora]
MVKRRRSVLSASFTASEEDLFRHKEERKTEEEPVLEEDEEDEEEMAIYHGKEQANHFYSQENLTFNLQDDNNNKNSVYYTNYDESEDDSSSQMTELSHKNSGSDISFYCQDAAAAATPYQSEETYHIPPIAAIQDTPKQEKPIVYLQDSAIDLSIGNYPSLKDQTSPVVELPPLEVPAKKTKKKVSSWSPRRIFSSSNTSSAKKLNKKSSSSSLNSLDSVESTESRERFHFSSLFSRKPGTKKSKQPSTNEKQQQLESKQLSSKVSLFNYTRLPINTERAIYRLSHIKLTNLRLPLRDQVVISNHMYWYLSVISANNESSTNVHQMIAMTKRHHRMQYQQKRSNKQNARHPSNKHKIPQSKQMLTTKRYPNTHLNSSSDDDDSEDDLIGSNSDDDDDDVFISRKPQLKPTIHLNSRNTKPKQTVNSHYNNDDEEEDDMPLAMYQKVKKVN